MKKAITKLVAITLIPSLLLVGCLSDSSGESKEENSEMVELTFWRNSGTDVENKVYEDLVTSFEEEHPNIDVKMTPIPFADYSTKLRTALASGNPPDVFAVDSPDLAAYAQAGALKSINKEVTEEADIEDFPDTTLEGLTYKDEIYALPIVQSGIAMFYNKNLFEEAGIESPPKDPNNPWTWEQVLDASKKLDALSESVYGIDPGQGFSDGEGPSYFKTPIIWQFGGEILSPDNTTANEYLNSKESLEALQFYKDLYHKHKVAAMELPPDPFATGKLGISINGSWVLSHYKNNFPDFKLDEDYGIAPLPKEDKQVSPNGGWALGISSKTEVSDEAWEFVNYLTSKEGQIKYVQATGDIPVRYSVAEEISELNEYPMNIFVTQLQEYSKNRPVTPAYPAVSKSIRKLFEEVGLLGREVGPAAEQAVKDIDKAIQKEIGK